MLERRQIVSLWRRGEASVLATLVGVEGSSYRAAGARLLTARSGSEYAGTISGGCLEGDVVRRAEWLVRSGAAVEQYNMSFDDTAEIPFGLGCGGVVHLLLEPVNSLEAEALLLALERSLQGEISTAITFLPGEGRTLRRLILGPGGDVVFASATLSEEKINCARSLEPGRSYPGRFVERLLPPQRLFLLGAGDDARPVARLAALLGWTVIVADGRKQLARPDRFPEAERVLNTQSAEPLGVGPDDACIVMTHSYEQDRTWLTGVLRLKPRYVGLLGSRHRSSLLVTEAAEALGWTLDRCCQNLFAPVGLDLGGDGPEAIALSIVSQVQALQHGRSGAGAPRALTPEEIAAQVAAGGPVYLQTVCALPA